MSQKHDVSLESRQILISQYICMYKHNPNNKVTFTGILNIVHGNTCISATNSN